MQDLEHLVEKSKKEYIEQKEISNKKIPLLKNQIRYYKTEVEILIKVKKENIIYFKNLLKEGVDVRDVGLCWIIFRLNELGAKVEFNDFPKFLDYVNVNYLLIYSDKIIKINKLKILLDLVRNERKNIMKSINFIDSNIRNKYDEIIAKKYISIPYDNIDEYIRELFHKFKVRMGNKYIILENFHKEKDDNYLKNAQEDMRKMVPSYRSINNKSKSRNHFLTETYTFNDYRGIKRQMVINKAYPGFKEEVLNTKLEEQKYPFPKNYKKSISHNPFYVFLILLGLFIGIPLLIGFIKSIIG